MLRLMLIYVLAAWASAMKLSTPSSAYDYVVIGSGIGGLSCAAMLNYYGYSVCVLESHDVPGGVAHAFEKDGFKFDAGPSLWNGMATRPYNPLREILELVGEGDSVKYAQYDGWVMHVPEGSFKFTVGANKFEPILQQFGGPTAVEEWRKLNEVLRPIQKLCTSFISTVRVLVVSLFLPSLGDSSADPEVGPRSDPHLAPAPSETHPRRSHREQSRRTLQGRLQDRSY